VYSSRSALVKSATARSRFRIGGLELRGRLSAGGNAV
jgi:hypothetical protein